MVAISFGILGHHGKTLPNQLKCYRWSLTCQCVITERRGSMRTHLAWSLSWLSCCCSSAVKARSTLKCFFLSSFITDVTCSLPANLKAQFTATLMSVGRLVGWLNKVERPTQQITGHFADNIFTALKSQPTVSKH